MATSIGNDSAIWSWSDANKRQQLNIVDNYTLHLLSDYLIIQPMVRDTKEYLVIDRTSEEIQILSSLPNVDEAVRRSIHGIIGVINLISGPNLIVITSKQRMGDINGHAIYKVQTTDIIPYARNMSHLNENQKKYNTKYLSMIELVLRTEAFYFSYSYDITHTFQRLQHPSQEFYSTPFIERADQRFVWNRYLLSPFSANRTAAQFALPLIHGFVALHTLNINGRSLSYGLISRRSTQRAGTRLFIRGIDDDGRVANYVETEQILQLNDIACSHVQIRGSVPCYWTQLPDLRYKPKVTVLPSNNHLIAFRQHFEEQEHYYGKIFLISLTNHHGAEGKLNAKYRELHEESQNKKNKFEDFDFHKECAGMRYDRLTILLARIIADLDDYSYFAISKTGILQGQQHGVFRTNCIDCLDRTNVVQSLIAKRILEEQLQRNNVIQYRETIDSYKQLSSIFKNVWADNADVISLQYAGTGALKTDYTRTGQRSAMGLLKDGYNSCVRYVLNNFYDGFRQDGIDLFLGNYRVSSDEGRTPESCPISKELSKKFLALPITMFLAFSMCIINLLIPAASFREQMTYVLFWGAATISTLAITIFWGQELVDAPKLYSKVKRD
ncbi:unnamed protein product [Rotaria socialis]|uniref:Phosphatidylinositol-3-phosphatase SAC1 n=1 Tax=Rotaria socialis TaxID=392032 RepID=A0A821B9W6_9BILA|nr:unnamed protein product [Rotaria socialis]CAF3343570.1 unnamed protein product [Rotaria socialis]CAF3371536.1 unnamed protein product [Rotaria socialis]CAF3375572.1 unnamed protein product [Rotaria socialis]CAF4213655.1 unnamed protein product [Rotaria socialis]